MNIIERVADLDGIQAAERLKINFFTGEEKAHKFILTPPEGTAALTGSVSATFLRADRTTWDLLGTLVDGNAEVILTSECYQCAGTFTFSVYLTEGESRVCVYVANGNVISTQTDPHYDGGMVTELTQLLGEAGELQESVAALDAKVEEYRNYIPDLPSKPSDTGAYVLLGLRPGLYGNVGFAWKKTNDWDLTMRNVASNGTLTLGKGTADEVTVTAAQMKQLLALLS